MVMSIKKIVITVLLILGFRIAAMEDLGNLEITNEELDFFLNSEISFVEESGKNFIKKKETQDLPEETEILMSGECLINKPSDKQEKVCKSELDTMCEIRNYALEIRQYLKKNDTKCIEIMDSMFFTPPCNGRDIHAAQNAHIEVCMLTQANFYASGNALSRLLEQKKNIKNEKFRNEIQLEIAEINSLKDLYFKELGDLKINMTKNTLQ